MGGPVVKLFDRLLTTIITLLT